MSCCESALCIPTQASRDWLWLRDELLVSQGTRTRGSPHTLAHMVGARARRVCLSRATRVLRGLLENALPRQELLEGTTQENRVSPRHSCHQLRVHIVTEMSDVTSADHRPCTEKQGLRSYPSQGLGQKYSPEMSRSMCVLVSWFWKL